MSLEDLVNESDKPEEPNEDPTETPVDPQAASDSQEPLESEAEGLERLNEVTTTSTQPTENVSTNTTDSPAPTAEPQDPILDAILNKIVPVKSKERRRNLKVLIYSDPGAGKSVLAGTAPNNLFIDCEDGLVSLDNHPDLVPDTVYAYPYKSFRGLEAVVQKLNENPPELAHIETVTMDTISDIHKKGLAEVVEREWSKSPAMSNRYVADTEHHTENNEHIRRLVTSLRDLDRNLILLSHARTIEPKNRPAKTFPDFSEKLANTLAGIVDIVGYMYLKEVEGVVHRVLRLQGTETIVAKTRVGGFPDEIYDPVWGNIWEIFKKSEYTD